MKFLILVKEKVGAPPLENWEDTVVKSRAFLEEGLEDGWLECVYNFANATGSVAIVDVESHEEIWTKLHAYPLSQVQTYEAIPLIDAMFAFDQIMAEMMAFEPA